MVTENTLSALLLGAGAGLEYAALVEIITGGDGVGYALVGANFIGISTFLNYQQNKEESKEQDYSQAQENSCSEN